MFHIQDLREELREHKQRKTYTSSIFQFILPKLTYKFNVILVIFVEVDKLILHFIWECEGSRIVETIAKKKADTRYKTYTIVVIKSISHCIDRDRTEHLLFS